VIPVPNPIPEPASFDRDCRRPGNQWLAAHPNADSKSCPSHWTRFEADLETAFVCRCGWWAMRIECGTVDHFFSKNKPANRRLVYEWSNYRSAAPTLNSSKKELDDQVLDPFEIQPGWFEVLLPSMQLVRTALVPAHLQAKADFTLRRLRLDNGPKVRRNRQRYYEDYKNHGLPPALLRDYAPLVAEAVARWEASGHPLP
jgi:hypothetical protein